MHSALPKTSGIRIAASQGHDAAVATVTPSRAYSTRETPRGAEAAARALRVSVEGGGCSGFQYGFEFDEGQNEDDFAIVTEGVTLLVDPLSLQYLAGASVDYSESLSGAQFVIRNPNAKTTCGCGSSFTV